MRRGIIGSTLAVFFIATVLFFSIYLFIPELSITVFGVSFSEPQLVNAQMLEKVIGKEIPQETVDEINELLTDEELKAALKKGGEFSAEQMKELKAILSELGL